MNQESTRFEDGNLSLEQELHLHLFEQHIQDLSRSELRDLLVRKKQKVLQQKNVIRELLRSLLLSRCERHIPE